MKTADERNNVWTSRRSAREFHARFNRFRARIGKEKCIERRGNDGEQLVHQVEHRFVINNVRLSVNQFAHLCLRGGNHFGMAMSGICDADAAREIEITRAVFGVNVRALGAVNENIGITRPNGREVFSSLWQHQRSLSMGWDNNATDQRGVGRTRRRGCFRFANGMGR
ncbi:MAG: hypothetical protein HDKAJFGB_03349 [Anaerolineae bacterium]|nr:hypothetical protein [Anaerolineae bacterium]